MSENSEPNHTLPLETLRQEYRLGQLDESSCDSNPIVQFELWMKHAQAVELKEPNAMTLATATADGKPSARIVLLKEVSENGLIFYTNYDSQKGRELAANPQAALTFYWSELERQVRIEGTVTRISRELSEEYFRVRPRNSRLGALASNQSQILASRKEIEAKMNELIAQYAGTDEIPKPEYWGGYCVWPILFEFWQGRRNRLHDRIRYTRESARQWKIERLYP